MKTNVTQIFNELKTNAIKHSPEILTGIGIAGMITSTVMAVKVTPKAILILEDRREELDVEKLSGKEVIKATWKCYIPPVLLSASSIACLIGASSVNAKRNAALATAYQLSQTALTEYKDKVVEVIGEKKERNIREKIDKDRIDNHPVSTSEIFITEKGNTLCYDAISGRYFKSDKDQIERAINQLNKRLMDEMYISLNEFYDALGLACTKLGNELGWNLDQGLVEVDFSAQVAEDGEPCLVVDYYVAPRYGYDKLM